MAIASPAAAEEPRVFVLDLEDTIQPASLRYIERGLALAADERADLVVIEIDTPGGLVVSLRTMTSAILESPTPVAVFVTPPGARAASAGFFLLISADVAAMAPGTNTGAAHPVMVGRSPPPREDGEPAKDPTADKAANDAAALARSLAAARGRSEEWAEKAVLESAAFTAIEARDRNLVDVIASDRDALLRTLDGRTITRFDGSTERLALAGAQVVMIERTLAERVLRLIADPQIAYLLLVLGALAVLFELTNPGLVVPGVAGGISLLLGLYGLSVLPVDVAGALLLAAGLALLIAEIFVTSYGLLAIAGLASFVLGSLMLVDTPVPELQIGPGVVIPLAIVLALTVALLAARAARTRGIRVQSGPEAMIGEAGEVVDPITLDHDGHVFVHGETWAATANRSLARGTRVRVESIDGLRLRVAPVGESS